MKKYLFIVLAALFIIMSFTAYRYYNFIFSPNVSLEKDSIFLNIKKGTSLEVLADSLIVKNIIRDKKSFVWVSKKMSYNKPRDGRYLINDKMSNRELIGRLRSGIQQPVSLTFNNVRNLRELCDLFGDILSSDADEFYNFFTDSLVMAELERTQDDMLCLFIPNTYEIYWNISPAELLERMVKEHARFWNESRKKLLNQKSLDSDEAYILASIVQKETNLQSEKPIIAGVYLNRLERGILLQADPTVVYATGDFEIRRVLNKHLETDSPYNTYKYAGLPPGPICMPDISTIDAVLNAEKHNYIYFCVKPGTGFEHAFARTLREHNRNAQAYRDWLNNSRIYN